MNGNFEAPAFQLRERHFLPEGLAKTIRNFINARAIACNQLTEKQFSEAITQAIACGDFIKQVRVGDGAQSVTYIPYAESERLRSRIAALESALKDAGIKLPESGFD